MGFTVKGAGLRGNDDGRERAEWRRVMMSGSDWPRLETVRGELEVGWAGRDELGTGANPLQEAQGN